MIYFLRVFWLFGWLACVGGSGYLVSNIWFSVTSEKVNGKITQISTAARSKYDTDHQRRNKVSTIDYDSNIIDAEFFDRKNVIHIATFDVGEDKHAIYNQLSIAHHLNTSEDALLYGFKSSFFGPIALIIMGLIFGLSASWVSSLCKDNCYLPRYNKSNFKKSHRNELMKKYILTCIIFLSTVQVSTANNTAELANKIISALSLETEIEFKPIGESLCLNEEYCGAFFGDSELLIHKLGLVELTYSSQIPLDEYISMCSAIFSQMSNNDLDYAKEAVIIAFSRAADEEGYITFMDDVRIDIEEIGNGEFQCSFLKL